MPEYVPYYTVVKEPGRQFLREFGSNVLWVKRYGLRGIWTRGATAMADLY